jgi:hypothetical protein
MDSLITAASYLLTAAAIYVGVLVVLAIAVGVVVFTIFKKFK